MSDDLIDEFRQRGFPALDRVENQELAKKISDRQCNMKPEDLIATLRHWRLDWLIRDVQAKPFKEAPEKYLKLERVGVFGTMQLDRILGWKY
jgi:hypothetical protein